MKSRQNYVCTSLIFVLFCLILWWLIVIKQGKMPYVDQWTRVFVDTLADTPVYTWFRWITELGSRSFVQPLTIGMTVIIWFMYRDFRPAVIFGFGVLGTHFLNTVMKEMVARERPSISIILNAEGYSFPSGHSMISLVCYGLLAYFISKKLRSTIMITVVYISFALIILLIGISRYVINVHFLTDIITGYTFGSVILICLIRIYERMEANKEKR